MSVRSAQSVTVLFTTRVWATGVATNADSTPTGTLYVNGTADAASVTVTNITTGVYKAAVTLPTLVLSDVVTLRISATVSSVADNAVVWTDTKDFFAGSIPDVAAGGSGGLLISGSNSGTTTLGALTVTGATTLTGAVSLGSTLSTTGTVTVSAFTVTNATTLSGAVSCGSTFGVTGTMTVNAFACTNNFTVSGNWLTTGTTTWTGAAAFSTGLTAAITGTLSGAVGSVAGAVGSVTGNVAGNITGSVGSLATQAKADVNAEVVDVIATDTYAEPGQGAPAATTSLAAKIGYLFKFLRNKIGQTSTTLSVYDDAGTTVDHKSTVSDDGTTYTRGEISSGP